MRKLLFFLILVSLTGCSMLGKIGGHGDGPCVVNARLQAERYYKLGYSTRYGYFVSKSKFTKSHKWCEYFKDGKWCRAKDTIPFKRKATYYRKTKWIDPDL